MRTIWVRWLSESAMSFSCSMTARATFTGAIGAGFPANGLLSRRTGICPIARDGDRTSASAATVATLRIERGIRRLSMSERKRPGGATTGRHHEMHPNSARCWGPGGKATGVLVLPRRGGGVRGSAGSDPAKEAHSAPHGFSQYDRADDIA